MNYRYTAILLNILAGLFISKLAVADFHPIEDIRNTAIRAAEKQHSLSEDTRIEAGYLDNRLRLAQCDKPLSAKPFSKAPHGTNMTVTVKCEGIKPWTVYVPVEIKSFANVYVAKRPLARDIPIKASDLVLVKREITTLTRGYLKNIDSIVGRTPRRLLTQGSIISPKDLAIEKVISKGHRISIVAETSGITVRMPGRALSDGSQGEVIQVENLSSNRTVEGVVLGPGTVKVSM